MDCFLKYSSPSNLKSLQKSPGYLLHKKLIVIPHKAPLNPTRPTAIKTLPANYPNPLKMPKILEAQSKLI
jgi:hypothetical protein